MEGVFTGIYKSGLWGPHGDGSGIGSDPSYNRAMQRHLAGLVKRYNVRSIVDVSCGACRWQAGFLRRHPGLTYHGIDIAPPALARARANLQGVPNARVAKGDLRTARLPPCDLLLCRDTLQHMSLANIKTALDNIARTKARIVVLGGYFPGQNVNIRDGDYFDFNPVLEPFGMVPDLVISEENDPSHPHKHLFVYIRKSLDM